MISVIIPTYNRAKMLPQAIESVLNQTYTDFELIVVDDGSTDATPQVLSSYGNKLHVISIEHAGVSCARNVGIQAARGEWIAFLDSDDTWKLQKLEKQIQWLKAHPQVRICHTDEIWVRHGKHLNAMKKHSKPSGWIYEACLPLCVVSPSAVMIHQCVFDKVGVFDETFPACEDYDLWLRMALYYPFGLLREKLVVKQGGHPDQLSQQHWGLDRFRVRALVKLLESGSLKEKQLIATKKMLKEKCQILAQGAQKRGKHEEAEKYLSLALGCSKSPRGKAAD